MTQRNPQKDVLKDGYPGESGQPPRRNAAPSASIISGSADDEAVAAIVAGCQAGDRGAQRQLYDAFHRLVYRLMVRMVGTDEASDLTQQVFLHLFRQIDKYSGRGRFDRWLYRVAVNEAYQHLRRRRRHDHRPLAYEPADPAASGNQRTDHRELMEQALARLEPELRSICLLREIEELSYREIAETLDIPEGTVGSRLNRARRELKEHLINLGWEP
jgi:RNA polymerase sigma-70 factor (ECF subfamily)